MYFEVKLLIPLTSKKIYEVLLYVSKKNYYLPKEDLVKKKKMT